MKKSNFDRYLDVQLKDPAFAARFERAGEALQLATLRRQAGLSQQELARTLKTSRLQISRLESSGYVPKANSLATLRDRLRRFAEERDWDQFHAPKNLAMALSVEAAELLEHFQWLSEEESNKLSARRREKVREELADVLLYLIRLADKLDVDLVRAASDKIERNARKCPVHKARGNSKKYTDL